MLKLLLVGVLLQLAQYSHEQVSDGDKLKVSVYYESLCPDSVRFITRQLYPAYQLIGSSLLIDFVPYGKASQQQENGRWTFKCQHGPDECWGNKAQACGLVRQSDQDKAVAFVKCVMNKSYPGNEAAIRGCAPSLEISGDDIISCANNEQGEELLAKLGDRTHSVDPTITFVPTIVFNDSFDADLQSGSLTDFLGTACKLLENKPAGCP